MVGTWELGWTYSKVQVSRRLGLGLGLQIFEVLETFSIQGGLLEEVVFTFSTAIFSRERDMCRRMSLNLYLIIVF